MIQILRPAAVPNVLALAGAAATVELCRAYDADPEGFQSGANSHSFVKAIYGHDSIKAALKASQHDKCCFCESKVTHVASGDVEHFRPKAAWRQNARSPLVRPGYYWLAYEWSNLLFCCEECNRRAKKNCFPLMNSKKRALCHSDAVSTERPLLIHPAEVDPEKYISFRQEYAYPVKNSRKGAETIKLLQLNDRESLVERRRDYLRDLETLKEAHTVLASLISKDISTGAVPDPNIASMVDELVDLLEDKMHPTSEYSALAKNVLSVSSKS